MPDEALDIYAVGKQWMWKFQHREGQREINELHVPVNTPVRVHHDVRGRAAQPVLPVVPHEDGRHAGPLHAAVVQRPRSRALPHLLRRVLRHAALRHDRPGRRDGRSRITRPGSAAAATEGTLAQRGEKLFRRSRLHHVPPRRRAGPRAGAERRVRPRGARWRAAARSSPTRTTSASRSSTRTAKVVEGFAPIMPTFQGRSARSSCSRSPSTFKSLPAASGCSQRCRARAGGAAADARRPQRRGKPAT